MTPEQAYEHCAEHGRNSELEKIILTDPKWACHYAKCVIKDRWIEAENVIANDPQWSCRYALFVIKGKLPENMHNMMLLHADYYAKIYLQFINKLTPTV